MGRHKSLWIQDALTNAKRGSLHRQLGVPMRKRIPVTLLRKIKTAEVGAVITNPTKTGKRRIKVTRLLKRRAVLAHTLRGFK